eukprot:UN04454
MVGESCLACRMRGNVYKPRNERMLTVSPIPAFDDNYLWLLESEGHDGYAVVDPGDATPVIETIQGKGLRLDYILITHKHADHIGGVRQLKSLWPDAVVYGPQNEPITELDR